MFVSNLLFIFLYVDFRNITELQGATALMEESVDRTTIDHALKKAS